MVDGLGGLHGTWADMLMVLAVLSLLVGNVVAIAQTNMKRMLGYSTIAHVGFILLAVFCRHSQGGLQPHSVLHTHLCCRDSWRIRHHHPAEPQRFRCRIAEDFKGLNQRSPWFGIHDDAHHAESWPAFRRWSASSAKLVLVIVIDAVLSSWLHRSRNPDGACFRCWRVLLPAGHLVHVF